MVQLGSIKNKENTGMLKRIEKNGFTSISSSKSEVPCFPMEYQRYNQKKISKVGITSEKY
jgi:hypothetical protein